MRDKSTRTLGR